MSCCGLLVRSAEPGLLGCQGPKHIYFRDLDGSLTGVTGTVLGQGTDWPRPAYAQGSGVLGGPCRYGLH